MLEANDFTGFEQFLRTEITKAWAEHKLTDKLPKTMQIDTVVEPTKAVTSVFLEEYGVYQDRGVKAVNIRYKFARARIEGLTSFGRLRIGLPLKEAKSFAFAVATLHKRIGMQIRTHGRGTQWFSNMINRNKTIIEQKITAIAGKEFSIEIDNMIKRFKK